MTRRRSTRAAVALDTNILDTEEQQEGENVIRGLTRLQEATPAGSWPRLELLWRSVEILDAWMPTRFPATPLMTGWNTAMSGYLTAVDHSMDTTLVPLTSL